LILIDFYSHYYRIEKELLDPFTDLTSDESSDDEPEEQIFPSEDARSSNVTLTMEERALKKRLKNVTLLPSKRYKKATY
jgi:hypothetical protein